MKSIMIFLLLFSSFAHAETQREWKCRLAKQEYEQLRQEYLYQNSVQGKAIQDQQDREACKHKIRPPLYNNFNYNVCVSSRKYKREHGGRGPLTDMLLGKSKQPSKKQVLQNYEQWINANCF